jgi:hypothetical protein
MPPKPRIQRKGPNVSQDAQSVAIKEEQDATAMPPPEPPVPILGREVDALSSCLKVRYDDLREFGLD